MMHTFQKRVKPIKKITLEIQDPDWLAVSIGDCGMLVRATLGRYFHVHRESQRIALAFAHRVIQILGLSSHDARLLTPQILMDVAEEVIDDPEHALLLCTTWQYVSEQVEFCSVGTNSILAFEGETVRKAINPHTINELLMSQGRTLDPKQQAPFVFTHALGSRQNKQSCRREDIRVALVPLLAETTIAIIQNPLLADARA